MNPLVSIVIPTRNRKAYLLDAIGAIRRHAPGAEIVVVDNSDDSGLQDDLAALIGAGGVRYAYSAEQMSVVDNFERGLAMALGEYVMMLGDDDCIGPGLEQIAGWASRNRIDAVVSYGDQFIANYFWPGVRSRFYGEGYAAKLFLRRCTGRGERIQQAQAIRRVADQFGGGLGRMPRAYHGLVSNQLIGRIRGKYGRVFGGVSPDIYSATLITVEASRCFLVDFPFVIPGASNASTAGQGAARTDRGGLRSTEHIARFGDGLEWDPRIPGFYSPYTVWAFSLLKALEKVGAQPEPSFPRLYARCLLHCRSEAASVWAAFAAWSPRGRRIPALLRLGWGLAEEAGSLGLKVLKRLRHPGAGGGARSFGGIARISDAYLALTAELELQGVALALEDVADGE